MEGVEGERVGLGNLSEASSPEIRETQKNLILFSPPHLDPIREPQYCKRPQRPPSSTSQSMMESLQHHLESVYIPASGGEFTPSQITHSESLTFSFGSEGSFFYPKTLVKPSGVKVWSMLSTEGKHKPVLWS